MAREQVTMRAGGVAQWGRQLPRLGKPHFLKVVSYECDLMSTLAIGGDGENLTYFRTVYVGMDEVDSKESVSGGYGYFHMDDIRSGERLGGRIQWRVEDGQDYGTFVFEGGTGAWAGASGSIDVRLDWCTRNPTENFDSGEPIVLVAFLEGTGVLDLPSMDGASADSASARDGRPKTLMAPSEQGA